MTEIFVCKPGAISDEDRSMLREQGIIVVQMDNPSDFRLIRSSAEPEFEAGELLKAAIIALSPDSDDGSNPARANRAQFFRALVASIQRTQSGQGGKP